MSGSVDAGRRAPSRPGRALWRAMGAALVALMSAGAAPAQASPPHSVCWVEFSGAELPGALGAEGATEKVWRNTASGLLIHHSRGDVLIDAGWSQRAAAQMQELAPAKRAMAERVLGGLAWRVSAPEALARVHAQARNLRWIIPTHGHYDHMAGAEDLGQAPILLSPAERQWLAKEQATPDVVAASDIAVLKSRFRSIRFQNRPYMGFPQTMDVFGDHAIVVVPLQGHTPGSVGVFVRTREGVLFDVGDAIFVNEAVERGLPKSAMLRAFADDDPAAADGQVAQLTAFHRAHPEVVILAAHDRTGWMKVFGDQPSCRP